MVLAALTPKRTAVVRIKAPTSEKPPLNAH
jgi:hypothetical protein